MVVVLPFRLAALPNQEFMPGYYHAAPTSERARIQAHGLQPADPWHNPQYRMEQRAPVGSPLYDVLRNQIDPGLYVTADPDVARTHGSNWYQGNYDLWHVPAAQVSDPKKDRDYGALGLEAFHVNHPLTPTLFEGPEHRYRKPPVIPDLNWATSRVSDAVKGDEDDYVSVIGQPAYDEWQFSPGAETDEGQARLDALVDTWTDPHDHAVGRGIELPDDTEPKPDANASLPDTNSSLPLPLAPGRPSPHARVASPLTELMSHLGLDVTWAPDTFGSGPGLSVGVIPSSDTPTDMGKTGQAIASGQWAYPHRTCVSDMGSDMASMWHDASGINRPSFKEFLTSRSIRECGKSELDPANVLSTNRGPNMERESGSLIDGTDGWESKFSDWGNNDPFAAPKVPDYYYHFAPTSERARILQHGLQPSRPGYSGHWNDVGKGIEPEDWIAHQPEGVYVSDTPEPNFSQASWPGGMVDQWRIPASQVQSIVPDPVMRGHHQVITHPVFPEMHMRFEDSPFGEKPFKQQNDAWEIPEGTQLVERALYDRDKTKWGIGKPNMVMGSWERWAMYPEHLITDQAPKLPDKFKTDEEDHENSKKLHPLPEGPPVWEVPRISAADPNWLKDWIAMNGPFMVHETSPGAYHKIMREGLLPHDTISSGSIYDGHLVPRANHVYLRHPGRGGMNLTHEDNTHHVVVDLRKIDPAKLNADEDAFMHQPHQQQYDTPLAWEEAMEDADGNPVYMNPTSMERRLQIRYGLGENDVLPSWGAYADKFQLNEPHHVAHSFNHMGTIAHEGGIHPSAFVPMAQAHEELRNWAPPSNGSWRWPGKPGDLWTNPTIDYTDSAGDAGYGNPDAWPSEWSVATPIPHQKAASQYYYHAAPTSERARIETHGLQPAAPRLNPQWNMEDFGGKPSPEVMKQPEGVYAVDDIDSIPWYMQNSDIWRIPAHSVQDVRPDKLVPGSYVIPHAVQPELHRKYEDSEEEYIKNQDREWENGLMPDDWLWDMAGQRDYGNWAPKQFGEWGIGRGTKRGLDPV